MSADIIIKIILFGIALSMDAFAVSITDGLIYVDINKKRSLFIALTFGLMQAIMPLIGFFLVELVGLLAGASTSQNVGNIMGTIVTWIAFALLLFIGSKMIYQSIKDIKKPKKEKKPKNFSIKEVLIMGVATAIDALGTGVALHSNLSTTSTIWLHVLIIMAITFIFSLVGLFLGNKIEKLLKGKYEITGIIGGIILLILAVWIAISHYI